MSLAEQRSAERAFGSVARASVGPDDRMPSDADLRDGVEMEERLTLIERHLPVLIEAADRELYRLAHQSYLVPGELKMLQALFDALCELEPGSAWLRYRQRLVARWLDTSEAPR